MHSNIDFREWIKWTWTFNLIVIFQLLIKWYDGKMLTLDRMLSITQEGGDKPTANLRHTPTFSDQHFIDRILKCPNGSSMSCFGISISQEEKAWWYAQNSLGMGHGVRVGVSIGSYGDNIISQNDHSTSCIFKVIFGIKVCHDQSYYNQCHSIGT